MTKYNFSNVNNNFGIQANQHVNKYKVSTGVADLYQMTGSGI